MNDTDHFIAAGAISALGNLDDLARQNGAFAFFHNLDDKTKGFLQGVLPSLLVAILYSVLPIALRCKFCDESSAKERDMILNWDVFLQFSRSCPAW